MSEDADDYETMVKKYQKEYNYKPEEIKEDTKTIVLRALLKLYPITVRGQKAGLFQSEIPDKKIVVRLQYIVIRNPQDSKPRKIGEVEQRESNYCLYMVSASDIHQALHEISLDTGIKFYFHVCKGSETYSWVVYCIDYPPHLSLENIPKTVNKKED